MEQDRKKVRSFEVAELANISRSTVSRVLGGDPRISEETRRRVLAAAEQLGYQPNLIARGLKNRNTGIFGVVVTNLDNPYHAHALQLLVEKMGERRIAPLVFVGNSPEGAEQAIDRLMSYQVDAVVALAAPFSRQIVDSCLAKRKPLVLMNGYEGSEPVGVVCGDNVAAGAMVADHLVGHGARHLAFFGGEDGTPISNQRLDGFRGCLRSRHGLEVETIVESPYRYDEAFSIAAKILRSQADGVFCANDTLAFALQDAARAIGTEPAIPMIVGYDNSMLSARPIYDLTSVDQNLEEMTSRAVEVATSMVDGSDEEATRLIIKPFLVERGSTRATRPSEKQQ